jgi:hemerythrin-like metal-binding protein
MQKLIQWNDKFNTGNTIIDYQHRHLVLLINGLEEATQNPELMPTLLEIILEEVTDYTDYHFKTEEQIMEKGHYSGLQEHKLLHRDFVEKLNLFKSEAQHGTVYIDRVFCYFLRDWLLGHIAVEDQKFIAELSSGQGLV